MEKQDSLTNLSQTFFEKGAISRAIGLLAIEIMLTINKAKKNKDRGVWYKTEYFRRYSLDKPSAPEDFWNTYDLGTPCFTLKNGVNPSDAIKAFAEGPTVTDCSCMVQFCRLYALLELWGEKKFNIIFKKLNIFIGNLPTNAANNFFPVIEYKPDALPNVKDLEIGDGLYIQGVPSYPEVNPKGESAGHNVFFQRDNKQRNVFVGFGDFFYTPRSEIDIKDILVLEYTLALKEKVLKKNPDPNFTVPPDAWEAKGLVLTKITRANEALINKITNTQGPELDKIIDEIKQKNDQELQVMDNAIDDFKSKYK